jgi:hypothetical protein
MGHILFVDESGDHNLANIDDNFPVFCLAGCAFESNYYNGEVRKTVDEFKLRWWGRTEVDLHSREIRKCEGDFSFLHDPAKKEAFYADLNGLVSSLRFRIIAIVILKNSHRDRYGPKAKHPYSLSLAFMLERYSKLIVRNGWAESGWILAESRGGDEDGALKAEYCRLVKQGTYYQSNLSNITSLWTEKKSANIAGLQIADLVAYPIAAKVLRPMMENKSLEILMEKFDVSPRGQILGFGLKIFPEPTTEHRLAFGQKDRARA